MTPFIYLAGPILGCNRAQANDWRIDVAMKLKEHGIVGISPLRCEPLVGERYGFGNDDPRFGTPEAIQSKNFMDVQRCDFTLAYLPTPQYLGWMGQNGAAGSSVYADQSWGTISELAWAFALSKPRCLVSDHAKVLKHPVLRAQAGWVLPDLDHAVDLIVGLFAGYAGGKNV
jgi:nucleoside 2-deoxyribosyltransferase